MGMVGSWYDQRVRGCGAGTRVLALSNVWTTSLFLNSTGDVSARVASYIMVKQERTVGPGVFTLTIILLSSFSVVVIFGFPALSLLVLFLVRLWLNYGVKEQRRFATVGISSSVSWLIFR